MNDHMRPLAPMPPLPDLVKLSKLETVFNSDPDYTQHFDYAAGSRADGKRKRVEERWKRRKRLGKGAYGIVWLEECFHGSQKGQLRAVKEISKEATGDFNKELNAIALLSRIRNQRCFVQPFGWYEDDEDVFLAMEYFPYGDLHQYLRRPLPEIESRQIVEQVLEGLHFMHDYGFVHRDLKPKNILVARKGPDWWVKIADFGVSKRTAEGLTALRTRIGTPGFLAPEVLFQAKDGLEQSYSNAVDIWSLGVVSFLILTGQIPFEDGMRLEQYTRGLFDFPMDALLANNVSGEACDFLRQSMQVAPAHRPQVEDCQQHPWFRRKLESAQSESDATALVPSSSQLGDTAPSASWSTHETLPAPTIDPSDRGPADDIIEAVNAEAVSAWKPLSIKHVLRCAADVWSVAYSPSGERLAAGQGDGTVQVWDPNMGTLVRKWKGHDKHPVWAIAYSPDGKRLVSGLPDHTCKIWDATTGAELKTLVGHRRAVAAAVFSPTGTRIASGSHDQSVRIWDSTTGMHLKVLRGHTERVRSVAYSPDGRYIASGSEDFTIRLWDSIKGTHWKTLQGHSAQVCTIQYSPSGEQIASGSSDHTIRFWNSSTGAHLKTLQDFPTSVIAVAYSLGGKQIASACAVSPDTTVRIWNSDLREETLLQTLRGHTSWIECLAYAPNRQELASASNDESIIIWDPTDKDGGIITRQTKKLPNRFKRLFR